MEIIHGLENVPRNPAALVTVGSFDGVHRGHQRILRQMRKSGAGPVTLLTFEPHPQSVVHPEIPPPPILTSFEERVALFENYGVDVLILAKFDVNFAQMTAADFVGEALYKSVGMSRIYVGPNHHFGHSRAGDVHLLQEIAHRLGFKVEVVEPIISRGAAISSSRIRKALTGGDARQAFNWLGRPYYLIGKVTRGAGRGKRLGFPTANQIISDPLKLAPPAGIYASVTEWDGDRWPSVTHIGPRPTYQEEDWTVETHIIGFDEDIYGRTIRVGLCQKLRNIIHYDSEKCLIAHIRLDCLSSMQTLTEAGFSPLARWFNRRLSGNGRDRYMR
ncbi:MAG: riboflavin biosynthesis protein RibF [Calditrichaeota bacterium]|nr:riboflavin biosynthesis protein RibF [Calditrichota bacterium]